MDPGGFRGNVVELTGALMSLQATLWIPTVRRNVVVDVVASHCH